MIVWGWLCEKKPVDISLKKRLEGDVAVVYGKELEICYLNKIGWQILDKSDGNNTLNDIAKYLLMIYEVDEDELKCDIVELIRDLQWKRLIRLE